ncbi:hypothetical protein BFP72_18605 [Reichenbachiella sp. 5M10]|uniref:lytic transglycosylase domain-containing protein n=1 Tax=Reichenbachiella sp. 5M10 TaxID=1889772 RepID=UPI000C15C74F|nr:lytic transglycosylase domain-containing protein [Reichenbachiella sp. 5M10]PIB37276.1 hypothetical protein BFP72_18605 [Reichenbachiella sp. 5M10]
MPKEIRYLLLGLVIGGGLIYLLKPARAVVETEAAVVAPTEVEASFNNGNGTITGYDLPEAITFAGEVVPMDREDVAERLDREVQVNAFWHSNAIILMKRAEKWLPVLDSILAVHEVPTDFKYLAVAESGLKNVVSPSNAVGFWQFLSGTAKDFGLIVSSEVDERYDPVKSTVAATKYLKKSYERFGDWTIVAASYNMGMRATSQVLSKQKAESYYDMIVSEEPARYVFRIIALKNLLENPEVFRFNVKDGYRLPKSKDTVLTTSVADWNDFAQGQDMTYYQLKKLNPWIRDYKLTIKQGQEFTVKVLSE